MRHVRAVRPAGMADRLPEAWKVYFEQAIGHPSATSEDWSSAVAPHPRRNLGCPLLVVQGANDPRVVRAESDDLVASRRPRQGGRVPRVRGRGPRCHPFRQQRRGATRRSPTSSSPISDPEPVVTLGSGPRERSFHAAVLSSSDPERPGTGRSVFARRRGSRPGVSLRAGGRRSVNRQVGRRGRR